MASAFNLIRGEPAYRREAFAAGLEAAGYAVQGAPRETPTPDDVLIIWNRYDRFAAHAMQFESAGARVVVAENGVFGRDWRGEAWYSLAMQYPAAIGGTFPRSGPDRWRSWNVPILDWQRGGNEVVVFAQRGIGPPGLAQPTDWHRKAAEQLAGSLRKHRNTRHFRVRIREHPGERFCLPLEADLQHACCTVSWSSSAALKGLLLGIPTSYGCAEWCGRFAGSPFAAGKLQVTEKEREPILEVLAWSTWNVGEISSGEPFVRLLRCESSSITPSPIRAVL